MRFNESQDGLSYGLSNTYTNIAIYESTFTEDDILANYKTYCSDNTISVSDSAMTVSEDVSGLDSSAFYTRSFDDILTVY